MDLDAKRKDFALLQPTAGKKPVVYFDNACQSLRPESVIEAMNKYYREYPACAGRSAHKLGNIVTKKVDEARQAVADFIGAKKKEEIIFTRNSTEGINLVAHSLNLKNGDVVLTTDKEHNSNLIVWQILAKKIGIEHKIVPSKDDNTFDLDAFEKIMDAVDAKLVSMVYSSNLDGVTNPVAEIIKIAHKHGAKVLLDAAQTAPHKKLDVSKLDVDFLVFSGHKMLGPSGTGVLYGKYKLLEELEPFLVGGDTVSSSTYTTHAFLPAPEKFEAGLQDYAGIIGLGEAVSYLKDVGMENIERREIELNEYATEELLKIPKLAIIGPSAASARGGIVSFYIDGIDSHQIALLLDQNAGVMIRSGQHCVHSWFSAVRNSAGGAQGGAQGGARAVKGSARASFYFYNTLDEVRIFVEALNKIAKLA